MKDVQNEKIEYDRSYSLHGLLNIRVKGSELVTKTTGLPCGYLGPVEIKLKVFADKEIPLMSNSISGSNKIDTHLTGVQFKRDLKVEKIGDIRNVNEGDPCPKFDPGKFKIKRGI